MMHVDIAEKLGVGDPEGSTRVGDELLELMRVGRVYQNHRMKWRLSNEERSKLLGFEALPAETARPNQDTDRWVDEAHAMPLRAKYPPRVLEQIKEDEQVTESVLHPDDTSSPSLGDEMAAMTAMDQIAAASAPSAVADCSEELSAESSGPEPAPVDIESADGGGIVDLPAMLQTPEPTDEELDAIEDEDHSTMTDEEARAILFAENVDVDEAYELEDTDEGGNRSLPLEATENSDTSETTGLPDGMDGKSLPVATLDDLVIQVLDERRVIERAAEANLGHVRNVAEMVEAAISALRRTEAAHLADLERVRSRISDLDVMLGKLGQEAAE
jgi:hypothetical protein